MGKAIPGRNGVTSMESGFTLTSQMPILSARMPLERVLKRKLSQDKQKDKYET